MSLRVLVTGGAGYLGSILCSRLLEEGHRVTVLDSLLHGPGGLFHLCADARFDFVRGDVRDEAALRRLLADADAVIPLAAIVGAPACDRDPLGAESVNLGAIRTLNRLRGSGQVVVFPTTNSGYGTRSGDVHCTEDTPLEPISLYGRTKVEAEAELLSSGGAVSLRLATVFGMSPRMRIDLLVNHFVYAAVTDGYIVVFEKDYRRNFVHVRDVADAFAFVLENLGAMTGRPFNVGLETANLSKAEVAFLIREQIPDVRVRFCETGSDPDKRNYIVSCRRLREAGFEAKRSLEEGITELIKGYRMLGWSAWKNE